MNEEQQPEPSAIPEEPAELGKEEHLVIPGSRGAGRASVEAIRPDDGLIVWAYDRSEELSDVVSGSGGIYPSTQVEHRHDPSEPAQITALRHLGAILRAR